VTLSDYTDGDYKCLYAVLWTRLLEHALALRQLTHRNVAAIYDAFTAENFAADSVSSGEQTASLSVYVIQVVNHRFITVVNFVFPPRSALKLRDGM